ncbi:MAG: AIR synthase family protein [Desulfurococcales archaeon]|nr:AIR synthase family protein [Desulfurococcales archaeon]
MPGESGNQIGKLPYPALAKLVASIRGVRWPSTVIGPGPGEDAGVVDLGNCFLVSHVDPITEAGSGIGRLAVVVSSNDVAVTGARPRWAQVLLLLPKGYSLSLVEDLAEEIGRAAEELGIEVIGGHTEYTPGLMKPIVAVYVMGCACKRCLVPTGNARDGDYVVQIGSAAREGASILVRDFRDLLLQRGVSEETIEKAVSLGERLSIINVALSLAEKGLVNSMHDATEGGILGSLVELALASGKLVEVWRSEIIVEDAVRSVTSALSLDPLRLISSGTLIAATSKGNLDDVIEEARTHGFEASVIGRVKEGPPRVRLVEDGRVVELKEPPVDEISRFWV